MTGEFKNLPLPWVLMQKSDVLHQNQVIQLKHQRLAGKRNDYLMAVIRVSWMSTRSTFPAAISFPATISLTGPLNRSWAGSPSAQSMCIEEIAPNLATASLSRIESGSEIANLPIATATD
ncbi:hypothetical protein QP150_19630 [Sphingomonas sp. 22L2VL55-3]